MRMEVFAAVLAAVCLLAKVETDSTFGFHMVVANGIDWLND